MSTASAHTQAAYRQCEALTRAAAGNFYYGIRLLPAPKRRAMCAVYAFARRVDDIADGTLAPEEKLRRLARAAQALERLNPEDADPVMAALADASARFELPADALDDLIEGVRMDVRGTSYADFKELKLYCRRVAGSIGRLCLAIFGTRVVRGWRGRGGGRAGGLPIQTSAQRVRWPMISAWRCSSPTSCATYARMPKGGACTCPGTTWCATTCTMTAPSTRLRCGR